MVEGKMTKTANYELLDRAERDEVLFISRLV